MDRDVLGVVNGLNRRRPRASLPHLSKPAPSASSSPLARAQQLPADADSAEGLSRPPRRSTSSLSSSVSSASVSVGRRYPRDRDTPSRAGSSVSVGASSLPSVPPLSARDRPSSGWSGDVLKPEPTHTAVAAAAASGVDGSSPGYPTKPSTHTPSTTPTLAEIAAEEQDRLFTKAALTSHRPVPRALSPSRPSKSTASVDTIAQARREQAQMDNEVAYLKAQLVSESRCRGELERELAKVRVEYERRLRQNEEELRVRREETRTEYIQRQESIRSELDAARRDVERMTAHTALLERQLTEAQIDVTDARGAQTAAEEALDALSARHSQMHVLNQALQEEVDDLKEAAARADGVGAIGAAIQLKDSSDVGHLQRQVDFLKQQLSDEVAHRTDVEAALTSVQTQATQDVAARTAELHAARAELHALRAQLSKHVATAKDELATASAELATAKRRAMDADNQTSQLRDDVRALTSTIDVKDSAIARLEAALESAEAHAVTATATSDSAASRHKQALAAAQLLANGIREEKDAELAGLRAELSSQMDQTMTEQADHLATRQQMNTAAVAHAQTLGATRMGAALSRWLTSRQHTAFRQWASVAVSTREQAKAKDAQTTAVASAVMSVRSAMHAEAEAKLESLGAQHAKALAVVRSEADADKAALVQSHQSALLDAEQAAQDELATKLADALAVAAAEAADAQTHAVADAVKQAVSATTASVTAELAVQHEQDTAVQLDSLKKELEARHAEELDAATKAAAEDTATTVTTDLEAKLAAVRAEHDAESASIQAHMLHIYLTVVTDQDRQTAAKIAALNAAHTAAVADLTAAHTATVDELERRHRDTLHTASRAADTVLRDSKSAWQAEAAAMKADTGQKMETLMMTLRADHARELEAVQARYEASQTEAVAFAVAAEKTAADARVKDLDAHWNDKWTTAHEERRAALKEERHLSSKRIYELQQALDKAEDLVVALQKVVEQQKKDATKAVADTIKATTLEVEARVVAEQTLAATAALAERDSEWQAKTDALKAEMAAAQTDAVRTAATTATATATASEACERLLCAAEEGRQAVVDSATHAVADLRHTLETERRVAETRQEVAVTEAFRDGQEKERLRLEPMLHQVQLDLEHSTMQHRSEMESQRRRHADQIDEKVAKARESFHDEWANQQQLVLDAMETAHRKALKDATDSAKASTAHALAVKDEEVAAAVAKGQEDVKQETIRGLKRLSELRNKHAQEMTTLASRLRDAQMTGQQLGDDLAAEKEASAALTRKLAVETDDCRAMSERLGMACEDVLAGCVADARRVQAATDAHIAELQEEFQAESAAQEAQLCAAFDAEKLEIEAQTRERIGMAVEAAEVDFQFRLDDAMAQASAAQTAALDDAANVAAAATKEASAKHKAHVRRLVKKRVAAVKAVTDEFNAEREQLLATAKEHTAKAVADAQAVAGEERKAALDEAAKAMEEAMDAQERRLNAEASAACDKVRQEVSEAAQQEQLLALAEVQEETEKLIGSIENAMHDMQKERDAYGRQNDMFKADLVMAKAQTIKLDKQVAFLKSAGTVSRYQSIMMYCRYITRYRSALTQWTGENQRLTTRLNAAEGELEQLRSMRDTFRDVLRASKASILSQHKAASAELQQEIDDLLKERTELTGNKQDMKIKIGATEGAIHTIEKEIREVASGSVVVGGTVDLAKARKKRRLDADLESLLDKLQLRRDEFFALDERLASLEELIESKEDEVRFIEASFVESLVEQQRTLCDAMQAAQLPPPLEPSWKDGGGNGSLGEEEEEQQTAGYGGGDGDGGEAQPRSHHPEVLTIVHEGDEATTTIEEQPPVPQLAWGVEP